MAGAGGDHALAARWKIEVVVVVEEAQVEEPRVGVVRVVEAAS